MTPPNHRKLVPMIRRNYELLLLLIVALLLYLPLMSCSLDEWDSYNFAFALKAYDVLRHQPHPPGYPLYVFVGRIALYLVGNPLTALTIVSAISGALTMAPTYLLSRRMYDRQTAVLTSLALMFTPALWITSESALTDTLFTFLLVSAIYLLYSGIKGSSKMLQISWFVYGFAIGGRPTLASLTLLVLWVPSTIFIAGKTRCRMLAVKWAVLFLASSLAWFVPMIWVVGWNNYWFVMQKQLVWATNMDFIWARPLGLDPLQKVSYMTMQILAFSLGGAYTFVDGIFGSANPLANLHGILLAAAIAACIINFRNIRGRLFLFLWVVPYLTFVYLFGSPDYPRYFLPIVPAIIIPLIASVVAVARCIFGQRLFGLGRSCIRSGLQLFLTAILITSFFVTTLPLAMTVHTQPAPTKQLFDYVIEHYPPGTVIIECNERRVFEFYPNEMQHLDSHIDQKRVIVELSHFSSKHTLLITSSAYRYFASHPAIAELRVRAIIEFFRDPRVSIEEHKVVLYEVVSVRLNQIEVTADSGFSTLSTLRVSFVIRAPQR